MNSDIPTPLSRAMLKTYILEGAVAIHSVVIGFGYGSLTQSEIVTIKILTGAFSVHQFFEGVSLGAAAVNTLLPPTTLFHFALIFGLTFPFGAIIGILIKLIPDENETSSSSPNSVLLIQGIANALAAGILLHSALSEMIPDDFSQGSGHNHGTHQLTKISTKFAMYLSLLMGFGVMAVLAIWA
jgi:zinc transporter ZupT